MKIVTKGGNCNSATSLLFCAVCKRPSNCPPPPALEDPEALEVLFLLLLTAKPDRLRPGGVIIVKYIMAEVKQHIHPM